MSYKIKEIYYTLQGEGAQTGRAAVFCRFAGCNLWSGHESDRTNAVCQFCDTDFVGADGPGGGSFPEPELLAQAVLDAWRPRFGQAFAAERNIELAGARAGRALPGGERPFVVCTGGEPLLQLDERLIAALHARGFFIAVETNGTLAPPAGLDWVCVSPKAGAGLLVTSGDELKLVYPQEGARPEQFESLDFRNFFLQPMDGPERERNTQLAVEYCLEHPHWRLSLQTHKYLNIP